MATSTSVRQIALGRRRPAPWDFGEGRGFFPLEQNSEPVTPRMLFGPGLWMRSQKMVKHVEKGQNMLLVDTRCRYALGRRGCHQRSCHGFFPCRALGSLDTQQTRQQRSRAYAHARRWPTPRALPEFKRQSAELQDGTSTLVRSYFSRT